MQPCLRDDHCIVSKQRYQQSVMLNLQGPFHSCSEIEKISLPKFQALPRTDLLINRQ